MDLYIRVLKARKFIVAAGVTLFALSAGTASAKAQQVISDWSTHHMIFSKPGSDTNGQQQDSQRLENNPRYQMQLRRRSPEWNNRFKNIESNYSEDRAQFESDMRVLGRRHDENSGIKRDWAVSIAPTGNGTPVDMYPAVYAASYTTASCSDYAVFPVNATGSATQPNLVGFNSLYAGTCGSTTPYTPTTQFAYYVGTGTGRAATFGTVNTSPVISELGTKVAFVANGGSGGAYFFVVTLGATSGNGTIGTPVELSTAGGTGYKVTAELDNDETITRSSPYIDYVDDIAYVGDDDGYLHQITCVFNRNSSTCTPTETVGGGWPVRVVGTGGTAMEMLSGPVFDSTSGHVFVGAANGYLYCENVGTNGGTAPAACSTPRISVADGSSSSGAVLDAPVVDGTAETVFAEANACGTTACNTTASHAILMQANTSLGGVVRATMGRVGGTGTNTTNLYDGDFDNTYYNSSAGDYGGYLYVCGNATTAATPTLYRIGFSTAGVMKGAVDTSGSYQLVATGSTGAAVSCTPITENFNGSTDYIFVGVQGHGAPTGCETGTTHEACIMNFEVGTNSGSASTFPTGPTAEFSLGGNGSGASGIVIDNSSSQTGASQIYFSNLQNGDATQVSQAALE